MQPTRAARAADARPSAGAARPHHKRPGFSWLARRSVHDDITPLRRDFHRSPRSCRHPCRSHQPSCQCTLRAHFLGSVGLAPLRLTCDCSRRGYRGGLCGVGWVCGGGCPCRFPAWAAGRERLRECRIAPHWGAASGSMAARLTCSRSSRWAARRPGTVAADSEVSQGRHKLAMTTQGHVGRDEHAPQRA